MVSSSHDAMPRVFQEDPKLLARTFKRLGYEFPNPCAVTVLPTEPTEPTHAGPPERRAGTLLKCDVERGRGYLLAVEAQWTKDPDQHASWALSLAYLHEKYGKPPILVLICPDEATARWAGAPYHLGVAKWRTMTVRPVVLGPHNVPLITDPADAADDLLLASFAAITHSNHPDVDLLLKSLAIALRQTDDETADVFKDFTEAGLGDSPAADTWRSLMSVPGYFFQSRTAEMLRAEGDARACAKYTLRALELRGLPIPESARTRITTCTDPATLTHWFDQALTTPSTDSLFTDS